MKVQEFIKAVNDGKYPSMYEMEDSIKGRGPLVEGGLNRKSFRHYVISTNVYQCDDGFVGVSGPTELFSECSSWADLFEACFAEEYVAQQSVTYRPKDE